MNVDWESARTPLIVALAIAVVVLVIFLVVVWNRKASVQPTPMQLLVRNLRASAMPVPSGAVYLTGNAHVPSMYLGGLRGAFYASHIVALVISPSYARAGLATFWRTEILLATPGDVEDFRGNVTFVKGTGVMRYVNDLYWLQPDLQDKATRMRWAATMGKNPNDYADPGTAEFLLPEVAKFYRDDMWSLLAVQEELAALDLNAQVRRAIPFGERQVNIRDENVSEDDKEQEEGDETQPKEANAR